MKGDKIIIPKISSININHYKPLFEKNIRKKIVNNRLLILGGNGMGKSTILQSIIYCIAGEADKNVEKDKIKQWNRKYFEGRISNLKEAFIEVDILFGDEKINIKRGFKSKNLISFSINDSPPKNEINAEKSFQEYIKESAGYESYFDYQIIIHKLCYLSEDRANLVWDSENQTKLMMLLFNDLIDVGDFSEKRDQLKKIDSKKRRINWHIGQKKKELKQISKQSDVLINNKDLSLLDIDSGSKDSTSKNLSELLSNLNKIIENKFESKNLIGESRKKINQLTLELEDLQTKLAAKEENLVLSQLENIQSKEVEMALHKLIHRHICPACGDKAEELSKQAQHWLENDNCTLCGSSKTSYPKESFPLLDANITEKLTEKFNVEHKLIENEKILNNLVYEEEKIFYEYNKLLFSKGNINTKIDIKKTYNPDDSENEIHYNNLTNTIEDLENELLQTNILFSQLQNELEKKSSDYYKTAHERTSEMAEIYKNYATSFLGVPCTLETKKAAIEFLDFELYVPKFEGQIRSNPESCSEAQRFFLDIAFRMTLLDLSKKISNTNSSFICETPENALDISYVKNVAEMFLVFTKSGHNLIATGNLQNSSIGRILLSDIDPDSKKESTINLLDFGKLSKVQTDNIDILNASFADILAITGKN